MDMELKHQIKAEDFLSLVYSLSTEACRYHDLEEYDVANLTMNQFTEFLEMKAKNKEVISLFVSK